MLSNLSDSRLLGIYPPLALMIRQLSDMLMLSYVLKVSCGLRSWDKQAADYAIGRDSQGHKIGSTITDAPPGHSYHQYGLAVDVAIEDSRSGLLDWDDSHPAWKDMIRKGQSLGMVSGDCWKTLKDGPHWQLSGRFPVSPTAEVIAIYKSGGTSAVWAAAFPTVQAYSPSS